MNFDRMELILVIFHVQVKDLATVDARGIVVSISCLLLPEGVPGRKISHILAWACWVTSDQKRRYRETKG